MQLTLFSISYAGFWVQQTLELPAFIVKAAELRYDAVMIAWKRSLGFRARQPAQLALRNQAMF